MLRKSMRYFGIGVGVILLASLAAPCSLLAASGTAKQPETATKASPSGEMVKTFTIGVGAAAVGTLNTLTSGLTSLITKHAPFKAVAENSPTMPSKSLHISNGTIDAYLMSSQAPLDEYLGNNTTGKKTRIRVATYAAYPASTRMAFCTRPDSGVKTVKDMKGKVVFADYTPSPYMKVMADAVFAVNGLKRSDCTWLKYSSSSDAFREVKEKRAHVVFFPLGVGSIDMASTVGLFLVPFSEAEQKAIEKATPGFYGCTIEKGSEGANADTPIVASDMALWIGVDVSEATAYQVVKSLYEHLDEFHAIFPAAKGFTLENACRGWVVPYHPGAILYFKEKGIWGPEQDKKQAALLAAEKVQYGDK